MRRIILGLVVGAMGISFSWAAPNGALVFPRNGGYEGRVGKAHVLFNSNAGGVMSVVEGEWPSLTDLSKVEMVFKVLPAGATVPVEVNQSNDHSPEIIVIEEGSQRVGVRVHFKLYDAKQRYLGHGTTETWIYPNGEIFVTAAAGFEGMMPNHGSKDTDTVNVPTGNATVIAAAPHPGSPQNESVTDAAIRITHPADLKTFLPGKGTVTGSFAFKDAALAGHEITLGATEAQPRMALYWQAGKPIYMDFVFRKQGDTPTYERWPVYFPQAYAGPAPDNVSITDNSIDLRWLQSNTTAKPNPSFVASFRMATPASVDAVKNFVAGENAPIDLKVEGGELYGTQGGYNDYEGAYVIRKTANPLKVTLPADPSGRNARVKVIGISGHGAVITKVNGKSVLPHLTGEGGIADDPLAPIREHPEGPADMAFLSVSLTAQPQTLEVSEVPGVQLAYQTRDPWRNIACFSTRGGGRWANFRFSLVDGRARDIRAYGNREWALTENYFHWFAVCGFTPQEMIEQLSDFEILKNGPDEAEFRYVSRNATESVESEFDVRVPANSPGMQMNVSAKFTVLKSWPYDAVQFFDVFPFRGVWPKDWWYDSVLWLSADGRWKTMSTLKRTYDGDKTLTRLTEGGFFAFYSSDRGNMLMLTKNFKPKNPVDYTICGNYVDFHMGMTFPDANGKPRVPDKDMSASVDYDLAIWGDKNTTKEQLIEIGKKSIAAGHLVLPGK
ncbi:MAG: hypothetical protein ABI443_02210 [Chthoniobacterales bacterium]